LEFDLEDLLRPLFWVVALDLLLFPVEDVLRAPLVPLEVDVEDDLPRPLFPLVEAFLEVAVPLEDDLLRLPFAVLPALLRFFVLCDEPLEDVLRGPLLLAELAFCEPPFFEVALWPPFWLLGAAPRVPLVLLVDVTALLEPFLPPGAAF